MINDIRAIQTELSRLRGSLPRPLTSQVQSLKIKNAAKAIVDHYFRDVRAAITQGGIAQNELADIDAEMQALLEHTHRNTNARKYVASIDSAKQATVKIEQLCLRATSPSSFPQGMNGADQKIVVTLEAMLPSAAASYKQAIQDLNGPDRLSWRGPATDLREALRETLDHLAPDADVEGQQGFRLETGTTKPTMKQKTRYVLSKRKVSGAASATTEDAASTVDEMLGKFVRSIYTRSSVSTHTPTQKEEVVSVHNFVRVALCELLEIHS